MTAILPSDILQKLPKESYKLFPFAPPPAGVQPNFDHPESLESLVLGLTIPFLTVVSVALAIRFYTKAVIARKWDWDDCTFERTWLC
jgi:hypothetical protein